MDISSAYHAGRNGGAFYGGANRAAWESGRREREESQVRMQRAWEETQRAQRKADDEYRQRQRNAAAFREQERQRKIQESIDRANAAPSYHASLYDHWSRVPLLPIYEGPLYDPYAPKRSSERVGPRQQKEEQSFCEILELIVELIGPAWIGLFVLAGAIFGAIAGFEMGRSHHFSMWLWIPLSAIWFVTGAVVGWAFSWIALFGLMLAAAAAIIYCFVKIFAAVFF